MGGDKLDWMHMKCHKYMFDVSKQTKVLTQKGGVTCHPNHPPPLATGLLHLSSIIDIRV
uniref:Uncharacterized protein n=1 Tax=Amphimedon queenslandica TaxID=400682 RepID=A0A1X7SRW6_AMPQE